MNSIGKMGRGQWQYYEDQVARGRDDYYAAGANRPGRWRGNGATRLGLQGEVGRGQLASVFAGHDPRSLYQHRHLIDDPRWQVPGYDLTFLGTKSVSVLWALADSETRLQIDRALDHANDQMLSWLEDKLAYGRMQGDDGRPVAVRGTGLTISTYAHNVSRNLDPHLHRHNLVLNAIERPNRRGELAYGALDGRLLYAYARPAGFLGQRILRQELTKALGVRWTKEQHLRGRTVEAAPGTKEIVGFHDREVLLGYSTRHEQIREQLEALGYASAKAAAAATLETRPGRPQSVLSEELERRWRTTADGFAIGPMTVQSALGQRVSLHAPTSDEVEAAFEHLQSSRGLTRLDSTFNRRDVVMALCEALPEEIELSPELVEELSERFLHERAVYAGQAGQEAKLKTSDVIRVGQDARSIGADMERYTTPEMLAAETAGLLAAASAPQLPAASTQLIDEAIRRRAEAGRPLSFEQAQTLYGLAQSGLRVQTVLGESGTGKTTMLDAFREVRERQDRPVLGLALAARAVRQLRDAHIRSRDLRTVASFQAWIESGAELAAGTTVVVDEAGMVGTRDLTRIQEAVLAAGGELVLVGDDEQLAEIDAGGYFRSLHRRLCDSHSGYQDKHELHQVLRQRNSADVEALRALRAGDVQATLANLDQRGLVFEGEDAAATERALIRDWLGLRQSGHQVLILARSRHRVSSLNSLAQAIRHRLGELGEESVPVAGNQLLRAGDQVRFRAACRELDLINGNEGTVEQVDPRQGAALIRYQDREGRERRSWFGPEWLHTARRDGTELVQLNYAATGNVAQGATAEVGLVFISDDADRQWAYTVLSRHTLEVRMYAVAEPAWLERAREVMHGVIAEPGKAERLALVAAAMARDTKKELATDIVARSDSRERATADAFAPLADVSAELARFAGAGAGRGKAEDHRPSGVVVASSGGPGEPLPWPAAVVLQPESEAELTLPILEEHGYRPAHVSTCDEALARCRNDEVGLLIVDWCFADRSPPRAHSQPDLLEALAETRPDLPVIVVAEVVWETDREAELSTRPSLTVSAHQTEQDLRKAIAYVERVSELVTKRKRDQGLSSDELHKLQALVSSRPVRARQSADPEPEPQLETLGRPFGREHR